MFYCKLAQRFTSQRHNQLSCGSFDATIRPSLGLGMLVNPTEWLQNEEIGLNSVNTIAQADFVEQLRAQVANSPHRALLIVLHGFREGYESALRKTAFCCTRIGNSPTSTGRSNTWC